MLRERTNAEGLSPETQRLIALPRCLWCGLGMDGESGRMHPRCQRHAEDLVADFRQHPVKYYTARAAQWCIRIERELELHYKRTAGL